MSQDLPHTTKGWRKYFARFSHKSVAPMALGLGLTSKSRISKKQAVALLVDAYMRRAPVLARLRLLERSQRLALGLVLDSKASRLEAEVLLAMHGRHQVEAGKAEEFVKGLIRQGLLLPIFPGGAWWNPDRVFQGWVDDVWLAVPAWFAEALGDLSELGGERLHEDVSGEVLDPTGTSAVIEPSSVIRYLQVTCSLVERYKVLVTVHGDPRQYTARFLDDQPGDFQGVLLLEWLDTACVLGLIESHEHLRWRCRPQRTRLTTEPLSVLLEAATRLQARNEGSLARRQQQEVYYWQETISRARDHMEQACLKALADSCAGGRRPGWFSERELELMTDSVIRRNQAPDPRSHYWYGTSAQLLSTGRDFRSAFVRRLWALGMLRRGRCERRQVYRLTALGVATFGSRGLSLLDGAAAWSGDGRLQLRDQGQQQLVQLALGALAQPAESGVLAVTPSGVEAALKGGMTPDKIEQRLQLLGGPLPGPLAAALARLAQKIRPLHVTDGVALLALASLSEAQRRLLQQRGIQPNGELVLVPQSSTREVASLLQVELEGSIDYRLGPKKLCKVKADGLTSIVARKNSWRDLRLRTALQAFGIELPLAHATKLSVERMPEARELSGKALDRRLTAALRTLDPHVQGDGIPRAVAVRLRAEAGQVDAPGVKQYLVLSFPEFVAGGLDDSGELGNEVELLPGGRLLVARKDLARVEQRLSELGIPFPLEHSAAQERIKARAAVGRLQTAVQLLDPGRTAPEPEPAGEATGPAPAAGGEYDPSEAVVLQALGRHECDRGIPARELAEAAGMEPTVARKVLKRLAAGGHVEQLGRGRGTRYRRP